MTDAMGPVGRTVETDLPLHVVELIPERPTGSEPTFVMLHGYGASSFTWREWSGALAERGRVLLVDMKGFGAAPKPKDRRYGPVHLAEIVVDFLDTLADTRITLIGHSLGGGVALLSTLLLRDGRLPGSDRNDPPASPDRIQRLVLIGAPAYRQPLPSFVVAARYPRLSSVLLRLVGTERVVRATFRSIVHDPAMVTDERVRAYAAPLRTPGGVQAVLEAGRAIVPPSIDHIAALIPTVRQPTLLLWGAGDRVVPVWIGRKLEEEMPDAELVIIDDCGHVPSEERPAESLAVVERFLDRT